MIKIGIVGGSFNPPHHGHLYISTLALKKLGINQIWWIPTRQNPLKKPNNFLNFDQRLKACESMIKNHSKIKLKNIDYFYSLDLIRILRQRYPKYQFIWVMGDDNLNKLHRWFRFRQLINNIEFAIFSRTTNPLRSRCCLALKICKPYSRGVNNLPKISFFNNPPLNISSTQIRHAQQI